MAVVSHKSVIFPLFEVLRNHLIDPDTGAFVAVLQALMQQNEKTLLETL